VLWVTAVLILIVGLTFLAATTPTVQTWLAHRVSAYLSKELHTNVYVDKVHLRFFKSMVLKGLFIADQHKDTLIYAGELSVDLNDISTKNHLLDIHELKLTDGGFFLREYNGEKGNNLDFIINYFTVADTADTSSSRLKITVENLRLENARFKYEVESDTIQPHGMDYSHIDVHSIYGDINNIHFINDSVFGNIRNLSAKERCGFVLLAFNGDAKLSSDEMRIRNLQVKTPYTDIHTDLTFNYDSFPDWTEWVEKMRWNSNFRNSTISFTDIAYFAGDYLWGIHNTVKLTGDCKGTVSRFRCKNVLLEYEKQTLFKGNVALTGLPNIEETYFDILAEQVTSTKRDVETIPVYPFDSGSHVRLPENLSQLGRVNFKGKFSGFYNDFVAYGNINTALGYLSSDINLKFNPSKKKEFYKGHLSAKDFNIGKLIGVADLGNISMSADVDGSGLRIDNMETKMKGEVSLLQFKGYDYHAIAVNGQLSKKLFDGTLVVNEPNVDLTFKGQVDFQDEIPVFDFNADINRLRVDKLNLVRLPGSAEISSHLEINFSGNRPDNWEGEVQINNFNYKADKSLYHINNISIASDLETNSRSIHVRSDFLDGNLKGQFEFKTLGDAFIQLIPDYFPALLPEHKKVISNQDFVFDFRLKNTSLITEIFMPSWTIDASTEFSGNFNSVLNKVNCSLTSNMIQYKNFKLQNENLSLDAGSEVVSIKSIADRIYYSDSSFIEAPVLLASGKMNEVDFILRFADSVEFANRGYFNGNLIIESPRQFDLKFHEAVVTLENKVWNLNKENKLHIDSTAFTCTKFTFECGDASVGLHGTVSENENDTLYFQAENFALSDMNSFLKKYSVNTGGVMNGSASFSNLYNKPLVLADLSVRSLAVNGDTLGNAVILSGYDTRKKAVHLSVNVLKNDFKTIYIDGDYFTARDGGNLDFEIKLMNFYMAPYERYMADVVSEVKGKMSSDLKLTGTFEKPLLNGTLDFSKASCKVNYLNTVYQVNDRVYVNQNAFEFRNFVIKDGKGNVGKANGRITHTFFNDFRFAVRVDVSKFEALHTTASQSDLYYGNAFVSGYADFNGPVESMKMDMMFRSEKGTEIFIPLSSSSEVSRSTYISFINKNDSTSKEEKARRINPSGITLDMRFELTSDATMEIIFDEKIGDKIKSTGNGNLRLTLDEGGNFNIFGSYYIGKGDYLFTLQNIINKHFTIDNGAIYWNGDPYNADINLTAFYKGGTSTLYKVMPEDSSLKRRLNYEVVLYLTNKLMNPTINYEINVSGLDNATAGTVYSRLNSEAELTRQVFGLMLLNQFLPRQNGTQQVEGISAAAGAGSSASELLSNQVSNWLSQLSTDVNLGFNYRPGDTYNKEEIEVMFSKNLFNDRLSIEGNVGVASDQSTRNIIGDFNAEYSLTRDARLKLKAFNRSNINNVLDYNSPYTQGVGIFYHEQFDSWNELLFHHRRAKKEEEKKEEEKKEKDKSNSSGTTPSE
jgi:hypothetical protein